MKLAARRGLRAGLLTFIPLAFGFCGPAAAGAYDDEMAATAAYRQGDYATALRLIRPLAEQGDPLAQVDLAGLYNDGHGVMKDVAVADSWYRKAASQDFAPGEYFLAQSQKQGGGLSALQSGTEASRLMHRAAEQGFAPAEFALGMFSMFGIFAQAPNARLTEAAQWLRKAVDAGYAPAETLLGLQHAIHIGLPQEQAEAIRLFRLAADQGDMTAEQSLGDILSREHGVPPDYNEAAKWYLKSAEQGDATAQGRLGVLYAKGEGVPKDTVKGRMWFELSLRRFSGKESAPERATMEKLFELESEKMTDADVAEAKREAADWSAHHTPKKAFSEETWLAPGSVATRAAPALDTSASPVNVCTHEEQVQAKLARQNGYTGGPKCD